jgi:hypothetical protein
MCTALQTSFVRTVGVRWIRVLCGMIYHSDTCTLYSKVLCEVVSNQVGYLVGSTCVVCVQGVLGFAAVANRPVKHPFWTRADGAPFTAKMLVSVV